MFTEGSPCIGVFLLAENKLLREAPAKVLGNKYGIRVVAAVAVDSAVSERVGELRPQILALDSSVFARIGLDIALLIHAVVSDIKILLVGMDNDKDTFLRCVRAGFSGYVLKEYRQARSLHNKRFNLLPRKSCCSGPG